MQSVQHPLERRPSSTRMSYELLARSARGSSDVLATLVPLFTPTAPDGK